MRNRYVAHMTTASEPTSNEAGDDSAERTVLLDADIDRVLEALTSPDLLSTWLGDWTEGGSAGSDGSAVDAAPGAAEVRTDDGLLRRVQRLDADAPNEVRWRWAPECDPSLWSDVRFTVTTEGGRTRLTVTETLAAGRPGAVASASATAPAVSWLGSLMALGAVLAVGSLVAV